MVRTLHPQFSLHLILILQKLTRRGAGREIAPFSEFRYYSYRRARKITAVIREMLISHLSQSMQIFQLSKRLPALREQNIFFGMLGAAKKQLAVTRVFELHFVQVLHCAH